MQDKDVRAARERLNRTRIRMNEVIGAYSGLFEDSGAVRQRIQNQDQKNREIEEENTQNGTRWTIRAVNTYEGGKDLTSERSRIPGNCFQLSDCLPRASIGGERLAIEAHVDEGMEKVYVECLQAMPYSFDLYLTCDGDIDPRQLCYLYADNMRVHDISVMKLPKNVHSYAGLFVYYRDVLPSHRFLLHIGSSDRERNILESAPRELCGDENTTRRIVSLLSCERAALVVEDSFTFLAPAEELLTDPSDTWHRQALRGRAFSYPVADSFWLRCDRLNLTAFSDRAEAYPTDPQSVDALGRALVSACIRQDLDLYVYDPTRYRVSRSLSERSFEPCTRKLARSLAHDAAAMESIVFDADGALLNRSGDFCVPRRDMVQLYTALQEKGAQKLYVVNNTKLPREELLLLLQRNGVALDTEHLLSSYTDCPEAGRQQVLYIGALDCANASRRAMMDEMNARGAGSGKKGLSFFALPSFEMQLDFADLRGVLRDMEDESTFEIAAWQLFNSPFALGPEDQVRPELQMLFGKSRRAAERIFLVQEAGKRTGTILYDSDDEVMREAVKVFGDGRFAGIPSGLCRLAGVRTMEDLTASVSRADYVGSLEGFLKTWFHAACPEEARDFPVCLPGRREDLLEAVKALAPSLLEEAEEARKKLSSLSLGGNVILAGTTFEACAVSGLTPLVDGKLHVLAEDFDASLFSGEREPYAPGAADPFWEKEKDTKERKEEKDSTRKTEKDARVLSPKEEIAHYQGRRTPLAAADLQRAEDAAGLMAARLNVSSVHTEEKQDYNEWYQMVRPGSEELEAQRKTVFRIQPKISIVIPVFRTDERMLRLLIDSILRQTYANLEICVADASDYAHLGRTGRGRLPKDVLADYAAKDPRVKYKVLTSNDGISENTNQAIAMTTGDFVAFADHDDEITPDAFYEIVKAVNEQPWIQILYSDEDKVDEFSKYFWMANFKPDFSPDMLRSTNYVCHLMVYRKSLLEDIAVRDEKGVHYEQKEYDGSQDHDLILRASERALQMEREDIAALQAGKPAREGGLTDLSVYEELLKKGMYTSLYIHHIPKVLYHWRVYALSTASNMDAKPYTNIAGEKAVAAHLKRMGIPFKRVEDGFSPGIYHTVFQNDNPLVSVIIPNKDHAKDLDKAIRSVLNGSYQNLEFIVVENNSTEKATEDYYQKIQKELPCVHVVYYKGGFNYSKINNYGVTFAKGRYLLFLNNDTEMIAPDSIDEMVGLCQRDDVGVVGVKLRYPDETYQHAGVALGVTAIAGHCFLNESEGTTYFNRAEFNINYSAETAACMMTKRDVFDAVGGFTEELAVAFNDIDFCMKVRTKGKLVVYNAYAAFHHYESKSRGLDLDPDKVEQSKKVERFHNEIRLFATRWKDILMEGDPYYNPNLTLLKQDFSLRDLTKEEIGKPFYSILTADIFGEEKPEEQEQSEA